MTNPQWLMVSMAEIWICASFYLDLKTPDCHGLFFFIADFQLECKYFSP